MNRNHLKIIACVSMLCDHIGYLLLPQAVWLRWIGRLALPLFAFFIGEGCRYTHDRKRYVLQLSVLAAGCQAVYFIEELLAGNGRLTASSGCWYFNILFTFALSCFACFLWLDGRKALRENKRKTAAGRFALLAGYLGILSLFTWFAWRQRETAGWSLYVDYGLCGALLPLSAVLAEKRTARLAAFGAMTVVYCAVFTRAMPYVWFSPAALPLLACYNGQGGSKKLKYLFYVFYPAHLAALYLLAQVI